MRRFVQADQRKMYMARHYNLSCQGIKDRLPDGELVIGDNTKKYLALLKSDNQKAVLLGMLYHVCKPDYLLTTGFSRI